MAQEGRRFRRRKKEDVFVCGYFLDHATDVTPGVGNQDEQHFLYGKDNPEVDSQPTVGSLSVTILEKFSNNDILAILTGQNPDAANPKQFRAEDMGSVHIWGNVKDAKNSKYIKSWILTGWTPALPVPGPGGANEKTTRQITGNGDLPRFFEGAWIKSKKIASGASPASLGDTPVAVPNETDPNTGAQNYAVAVKAIRDAGGVFEQEEIPVTSTLVSSTGGVSFTEMNTTAKELSGPITHAMIYYLQSGTGVHPTIVQGKLRG